MSDEKHFLRVMLLAVVLIATIAIIGMIILVIKGPTALATGSNIVTAQDSSTAASSTTLSSGQLTVADNLNAQRGASS